MHFLRVFTLIFRVRFLYHTSKIAERDLMLVGSAADFIFHLSTIGFFRILNWKSYSEEFLYFSYIYHLDWWKSLVREYPSYMRRFRFWCLWWTGFTVDAIVNIIMCDASRGGGNDDRISMIFLIRYQSTLTLALVGCLIYILYTFEDHVSSCVSNQCCCTNVPLQRGRCLALAVTFVTKLFALHCLKNTSTCDQATTAKWPTRVPA